MTDTKPLIQEAKRKASKVYIYKITTSISYANCRKLKIDVMIMKEVGV